MFLPSESRKLKDILPSLYTTRYSVHNQILSLIDFLYTNLTHRETFSVLISLTERLSLH